MLQVFSKSDRPASGPACPAKVQGLAGLIGNTPLVRVASLSEATGCEVNPSAGIPVVEYKCMQSPYAMQARASPAALAAWTWQISIVKWHCQFSSCATFKSLAMPCTPASVTASHQSRWVILVFTTSKSCTAMPHMCRCTYLYPMPPCTLATLVV